MNKPNLPAIFRMLSDKLGAGRNPSYGPWRPDEKPYKVDDGTWRRWLKGDHSPKGSSAERVARAMWCAIGEDQILRDNLFEEVRKIVPGISRKDWTGKTVGAWFSQLAEMERQGQDENSGDAPLHATLDLLVWRAKLHDFISVRQAGARPLRGGDAIRLRVTATEPLYLYLVWVMIEPRNTRREAVPFYPWQGSWTESSINEVPSESVDIPQKHEQAWSMEDKPGLETVILLGRQEPLSDELREEMGERFRAVIRVVNAKPKLDRADYLHEFPTSEQIAAEFRIPTTLVVIDDPIYQLTAALRDQLSEDFPLIRTLTVANVGKERI